MKKSKQKKAEDAPAGVSLSQMASTKQKGRRALVLLSVALVLGGAGYGGYRTYTWYKDRTSTNQAGISCAEQSSKSCSVLKEAKPLLDPKKVQELSKVVARIQEVSGYKQDPDLLYVVLTYYINLSDAANARKYYDLLAEVYQPGVGYDPILGSQTLKPEELKVTVMFLEQQNESLKANFGGVPKDEK